MTGSDPYSDDADNPGDTGGTPRSDAGSDAAGPSSDAPLDPSPDPPAPGAADPARIDASDQTHPNTSDDAADAASSEDPATAGGETPDAGPGDTPNAGLGDIPDAPANGPFIGPPDEAIDARAHETGVSPNAGTDKTSVSPDGGSAGTGVPPGGGPAGSDPPPAPGPDDPSGPEYMEHTRMSFGDHLEELRTRVIRALIGVLLGAVLGLSFAKWIVVIIAQPFAAAADHHGLSGQLQALAPQAAFLVYLKVGLISGVILAMPWVIHQIWAFVAAGLYPKEQRFARMFTPASVGLFVVGVSFMYFIVLPIILNFFMTFNESFSDFGLEPNPLQRLLFGETADEPAEPVPPPAYLPQVPDAIVETDPPNAAPGQVWFNRTTGKLVLQGTEHRWILQAQRGDRNFGIRSDFGIDFYVSFVLLLALAFGIAFQMPIAVLFLVWSGLVSVAQMGKARRYVVLVIFVLAAILTPPDVVSQILLAIPMMLLFELGLLVARRTKRHT